MKRPILTDENRAQAVRILSTVIPALEDVAELMVGARLTARAVKLKYRAYDFRALIERRKRRTP